MAASPTPQNRLESTRIVVSDFLISPLRQFMALEASSGILLLLVTAVALVWANSGAAHSYHVLWETPFGVQFGEHTLMRPLHFWVNDALMAVFFFVVGLDIKREIVAGELRQWQTAALPFFAAVGGMVGPGLIFYAVLGGTEYARGWGIPTATDIAFSLGVLMLLGNRVPLALRVFLMTFAVVDDLGAVLLIAVFYNSGFEVAVLLIALGLVALLLAMNYSNVRSLALYAIIGVVLWAVLLVGDLHPTIAGVVLALFIPADPKVRFEELREDLRESIRKLDCAPDCGVKGLLTVEQADAVREVRTQLADIHSPVQKLADGLHSVVLYFIMPVFALANAGVTLPQGAGLGTVFGVLPLTLAVAMLLGKVVGITLFSYVAKWTGVARFPAELNFRRLVGMGILGGIGFTMSLFVASLAYQTNPAALDTAKLGILLGSFVCGILGYVYCRWALR
jgi:NhaA family Na+:H+ antiporter